MVSGATRMVCRNGLLRMKSLTRHQCAQGSLHACPARFIDEDAALANPLAVVLHAPVGVVADATGLADGGVPALSSVESSLAVLCSPPS